LLRAQNGQTAPAINGSRSALRSISGIRVKTRTDVEQFRKGRILPLDLLQPALAEKVWALVLRGDYDIAVFQAFKVVEVAVRNAANAKSASYPDDLVGKDLMQRAFHTDSGPLRDPGHGDQQSGKAASQPATQLSNLGVTVTPVVTPKS
jgi:hypothetical protein